MTLTLDKDNPLATKVQTRDGRSVVLLAFNLRGEYPIAAHVDDGAVDTVRRYTENGSFYAGDKIPSPHDLINVPVPPVEHRVWVNVIKWSDGSMTGHLFGTHTQADACANLWRIACVEVVFKEGDGL